MKRIRKHQHSTPYGFFISLVLFSLALSGFVFSLAYAVSAQAPVTGPVLNVSLPTVLDFYTASHNLTDNGTLFSPGYKMINYGSVDVEISISKLKYTLSDSSMIDSCSEPPDKNIENGKKAVFMMFRPISQAELDEDEDQFIGGDPEWLMSHRDQDFVITDQTGDTDIKILLKAANYDDEGNFISLHEDSTFLFALVGDIRSNDDIPWQSGDISLSIVYSLHAVEPEPAEVVMEEMTTFDVPTPTPSAEITESPLPSESPDNTASPLPTKTPDNTASPLPTETPDNTASPLPTETPDNNASPLPTETPMYTPSPLPTEVPDNTEPPLPTETPVHTATPQPTETPVQTAAPKPAESPSNAAET